MMELLKDTFREWREDKATTLGAALAYFTIFSLAPLLIIVIAIAGFVFGEQAARGQIIGQISGVVGESAARTIQDLAASANKPTAGIVGIAVGTVTLLLGAAGMFGQLKESMNIIWEAKPKAGGGIKSFVKDKFLSFTMVLGVGFLLLVSLVLSAALGAFGELLTDLLPALWPVLRLANLVLSLGMITALFAMIFKMLPDVEIRWRDVWLGAFVTALLFVIGKELIALYIGLSNVGSVYGAASSLIVILVWIFYSAQILFFGAEFTQVYATKRQGRRLSQVEGQGVLDSSTASPAEQPLEADDRQQLPVPQWAQFSRPVTVQHHSRGIPKIGYMAGAVALAVASIAGAIRLRKA